MTKRRDFKQDKALGQRLIEEPGEPGRRQSSCRRGAEGERLLRKARQPTLLLTSTIGSAPLCYSRQRKFAKAQVSSCCEGGVLCD